MKRKLLVILLLVSTAGCQPQGSEATPPAVRALVSYLNALVDKDETILTLLSCADWESKALMELDAFQAVETNLEGLSCQQANVDTDSVYVTCEGKIITSYGGEVQEYDLDQRKYSMVKQDGDWLVCGY